MINVMGRNSRLVAAVLSGMACCVIAFAGPPTRLAVSEILPKTRAAGPFLSRPVAVVCDEESVYVLDSGDADIKIYSRDGEFSRVIGRKGQGPAEFRLPNDLDVFSGRLYVADSGNRRVQILDAVGKPLGGFGLEETPWRVLILGDDKILVSSLPSARTKGAKLIRCFGRDGAPAWQAVNPLDSGDSVLDALRNQVLMRRAPGGGFWFVRSFDDRAIRTMTADGFLTGEAAAPETALPFKDIAVPTAKGKRILKGFCWSSAAGEGRLYLLSPEHTQDQDLGPGRTIAVFGKALEIEALIELPETLTRFAVAGDTIYAVDTDFRLRLFRFDRRKLASQ